MNINLSEQERSDIADALREAVEARSAYLRYSSSPDSSYVEREVNDMIEQRNRWRRLIREFNHG